MFLKTHKTGGTTITNIINRHGDRHNLQFVLPKNKYNRLGWPWFFQTDHVMHHHGTTPNILCNHARYNRAEMDKLMPNDTLYITILRDPVRQFESTFSYMTFGEILGIVNESDPLAAFFRNPREVLLNYLLTQDLRINSDRLKLIRNGMFYDLGLESKDFENNEKINETIRQLHKEFHLVMITEYFDESLILLKRLLCWDFSDMIHFHLNQRTKSHEKINISKELEQKIKEWSKADSLLYEHFKKVFYRKIQEQPQGFFKEVRELRQKKNEIKEKCLEPTNVTRKGYDTRGLRIRDNITTTLRPLCEKMSWSEIKYLRYLKAKQVRMFENSKGLSWKFRRWVKSFYT